MKFISLKQVVVLGFVTLLSACGGGGGSSSTVAVAPVPFGIKQMGVVGAVTIGRATATDASGNVYVAGDTTGGLDSNSLTGIHDFFLTKYSASGTKIYTKQLGVANYVTIGTSVATDASGNVYVAGSTTGNLVSGSGASTGPQDFFLIKYDSNGNKKYIVQTGVPGYVSVANSVATDAVGNVYVAGVTTGNLVNGSGASTGINDFFLAKYDSNGNKKYLVQTGVPGYVSFANSVATDAGGNVYVAGDTNGNLVNGSGASTGSNDFFLAKYNTSGNRLNITQRGVAYHTTISNGVATDAYGNVYVAGTTTGSLDGASTMTSGQEDFFIAKYDAATFTSLYIKQMGVAGITTQANSVETDSSGNVFVAGGTYGGLDGNTLTGSEDYFFTKYDINGNKLYTKQAGVAGQAAEFLGSAIDKNGNLYFTGDTSGGLGGNIQSGLADFFLAKYNGSGVLQ